MTLANFPQFVAGVAPVVRFGFVPALRTLPRAQTALAMPTVIETVMLSIAALILVATAVAVITGLFPARVIFGAAGG